MNGLTMTPVMIAQEIAHCFNGSGERQFWRAAVAGTRTAPAVNFNSRGSMVQLTYNVSSGVFYITFSRTACSFGDFIASAHRSLWQVLLGLKAAGLPFDAPTDEKDGTARFEYDPETKVVSVHMAKLADPWTEAQPVSFKVS